MLEWVERFVPKRLLEICRGNAVRVIGRWSKSDREIAEGDVVELLRDGKPTIYILGRETSPQYTA